MIFRVSTKGLILFVAIKDDWTISRGTCNICILVHVSERACHHINDSLLNDISRGVNRTVRGWRIISCEVNVVAGLRSLIERLAFDRYIIFAERVLAEIIFAESIAFFLILDIRSFWIGKSVRFLRV